MAVVAFPLAGTNVRFPATRTSGPQASRDKDRHFDDVAALIRPSSASPMPTYRLFCLNIANGHMELVRAFKAANDDAAIPLAQSWRNHRSAELWKGYRVVGNWKVD